LNIRSDDDEEITENMVRSWLQCLGVAISYIEPGSPWENGFVESFLGKLRDGLLNGDVLDILVEAKVLVEGWRTEYNRFRPYSSIGYRPPAPKAKKTPLLAGPVYG
jgi:transposase InsO family protein